MRPTRTTSTIGALSLATALALAGCGVKATQETVAEASTTTSSAASTTTDTGPEEQSTTTSEAEVETTTTTTAPADDDAKADFLARANEICRVGADALAGSEPSSNDQEALAAYVKDVFVPAVRKQIDDIRALGLPPGDEAELTAIFDATYAALDRLAADPITIVNSGEDPFDRVNQQLIAYGLTDCGA